MWTKMPFRFADEDWSGRLLPSSGLADRPCRLWVFRCSGYCRGGALVLVIFFAAFVVTDSLGYRDYLLGSQYGLYGVVFLVLWRLLRRLSDGGFGMWAKGRWWACGLLAFSVAFGVGVDVVFRCFGPLVVPFVVSAGFWGVMRGVERRLTSDPVPALSAGGMSVSVRGYAPLGRRGNRVMRFDDEQGGGLLVDRGVWADHEPYRRMARTFAWLLLCFGALIAFMGVMFAFMGADDGRDWGLLAGGMSGAAQGALMFMLGICLFSLSRRPMEWVYRWANVFEWLAVLAGLAGLACVCTPMAMVNKWDWRGLFVMLPCVIVVYAWQSVRNHLVIDDDDQ